jgi:NAD-dependent SIR2 family protein deacetylase
VCLAHFGRPLVLLFDESYDGHEQFQAHRARRALDDAEVIVFVGTSFSVVAPPTLDCNRVAVNRPGTLYVLGQTGAGAGVLAAIIVDSTKLDPTAPWPKWQRTAGNAGNPAFPLNPGCP